MLARILATVTERLTGGYYADGAIGVASSARGRVARWHARRPSLSRFQTVILPGSPGYAHYLSVQVPQHGPSSDEGPCFSSFTFHLESQKPVWSLMDASYLFVLYRWAWRCMSERCILCSSSFLFCFVSRYCRKLDAIEICTEDLNAMLNYMRHMCAHAHRSFGMCRVFRWRSYSPSAPRLSRCRGASAPPPSLLSSTLRRGGHSQLQADAGHDGRALTAWRRRERAGRRVD